jgi:hypothetical protein
MVGTARIEFRLPDVIAPVEPHEPGLLKKNKDGLAMSVADR